MSSPAVIAVEAIAARIHVLRDQRVMLDYDLAALYGVTAKRLNEQVRRNLERFPPDFIFTLNNHELARLRSQFATSNAASSGRGGRRYALRAFNEHGAIMAAMVLNSARATEVSVYVVRAFVQLRNVLLSHEELSKRLDELEAKMEKRLLTQDEAIMNVLTAIRQLMRSDDESKRRRIGFV
jgi:hypothetical protein